MFGIALLSVTLALALVAPWVAAWLESALQRRTVRRTMAFLARAGVALNGPDSTSVEPVAAVTARTFDVHETGNPEERGRDREEA
jgi:hypothetical protein